MKNHFRRILTIILLFCAIWLSLEGMVRATPLSRDTRGSILHVVPMNKTGDCASWVTACELQAALARVNGGD